MQLENWAELLNQFLDTLEASGYSEHTLKAYYVDLKQYFMFTTSLDQKTVDDYLMHLSKKRHGTHITKSIFYLHLENSAVS